MSTRATVIALLLILFLVVVLPVLMPWFAISANGLGALTEGDRLLYLLGRTIVLVSWVLLLTIPLGTVLAILLERTDLRGRLLLRHLMLVLMFVPLPLFALAWQSAVGTIDRAWTTGVFPAALIHSLAALPWVIWFVCLGLSRVEPEIEEDALTSLPAWRVLLGVTLVRARPAIVWATVYVIIQTAGEITVTDFAEVRTFAEEVYTQFVIAGPDAQGRAVVVATPSVLLGVVLVLLSARLLGRISASVGSPRGPLRVHLGSARTGVSLVIWCLVGSQVFVPLYALLRQAGGREFQIERLGRELYRAFRLNLDLIGDSLFWSLVAGIIASVLTTALLWQAIQRPWIGKLSAFLAVVAWAMPGPVLGFGLKSTIELLITIEESIVTDGPIRALLYEASTPLPVLWAHVVRFFPVAVIIVGPAIRDVPIDLIHSSRSEGARGWTLFRLVGWPIVRRSWFISALVISALALGELSASKIVQVPGRPTFVQELFAQMHYGATSTTAALALAQLTTSLVLVTMVGRMLGRHT